MQFKVFPHEYLIEYYEELRMLLKQLGIYTAFQREYDIIDERVAYVLRNSEKTLGDDYLRVSKAVDLRMQGFIFFVLWSFTFMPEASNTVEDMVFFVRDGVNDLKPDISNIEKRD